MNILKSIKYGLKNFLRELHIGFLSLAAHDAMTVEQRNMYADAIEELLNQAEEEKKQQELDKQEIKKAFIKKIKSQKVAKNNSVSKETKPAQPTASKTDNGKQ